MSKQNTRLKKIFLITTLIFPNLVLAKTLGEILTMISTTLLKPLVGIFLTAAVVVFFWGMVKYIKSLGEKEKADGRTLMIWGVVTLFVMVSVWGLVGVIVNTLDLDNAPVKSIVIPSSGGGTKLKDGSFKID